MNTLGNMIQRTADGSAVLGNLENTSMDLFEVAGQYTWVLIAFALIACGGLYLLGGEEGKMRANKWMPRILIGTVLIICAVSLAEWISGIIAG